MANILTPDNLISTDDLRGQRVYGGKNGTRKIGKVRTVVFHPHERRAIGFLVRRPDFLLMFHRKDIFVACDGFTVVEGRIVISPDPKATGKAACKRLGADLDECVLWVGLPIMCQDGTTFGSVGTVHFEAATGKVCAVEADCGATANTLLGRRIVPVSHILGFRTGIGARLADARGALEEGDSHVVGALLVSDDVKNMKVEGGLAEQAGKASAVVVAKAKGTADKAKAAAESVMEKAKPTIDAAAKTAGEAVDKGAFVVGRQVVRAQGMFSSFKEEYDKARKGD